jgi:hypothetical protein
VSSSTVFESGFGDSRQNPAWQPDEDGVLFAVLGKSTDDLAVTWSLIDYLANSETVSSASYADSGVTTSGKSVSTPSVLFSITGIGETEVSATLSTGRVVTRRFRTYLAQTRHREKDYG